MKLVSTADFVETPLVADLAGTQWGSKRYLNMELLWEQELNQKLDPVEAV